jgi:hypothetical protein
MSTILLLIACLDPGTDTPDPVPGPTPVATPDGEPTAACLAYLDCLSVVSPATVAQVVDQFGANGSCWEPGADADLCDVACTEGLEDVRGAPDSPTTCYHGADDDEIVDDHEVLCDGLAVPNTLDETQTTCIAPVVLACPDDAQAQVDACLVVPTPTPVPSFVPGIWQVETIADPSPDGCDPVGTIRRFQVDGDGFTVSGASLIDASGTVLSTGTNCYGPGVGCGFFDQGFQTFLTFDTTTTLTGSLLIAAPGGGTCAFVDVSGFLEP